MKQNKNQKQEFNLTDPEWVKVHEACKWSRLCRTTLYQLMNEGLVRSYSNRRPGQIKGTRLVHFASLRDYLNKNATGGE